MKCTVWGIQSITMSYLCMVTYRNQIYRGDQFEMCRNIESLGCVTETNIVLQVNYTSKTNKVIKKDQICAARGGGKGREHNWVKAFKM